MDAPARGGCLMAFDAYVDSVVLGPVVLPPTGTRGVAWMKASPKVKLDKKEAQGKNGERITLQGVASADVEITCRIVPVGGTQAARRAARQAAVDVVREIVRMMREGPQQVAHLQADACDVGSVQLEEIPNGIEWDGGSWRFTLKGLGFSAAAATGQTCQLLLLRGSTDATTAGEVSKWQKFLIDEGYTSDPIDGVFGADTKSATMAFQTAEAILVDGIVGPQTFGAAAKHGYTPPAPKACGSATKTPTKADPAEPSKEFGPPTADEFALQQFQEAMDQWANGFGQPPAPPPDGQAIDPFAGVFGSGGQP
jgi:peptidoglycan hydrolase-like protein with peptidoglycan-binding domain